MPVTAAAERSLPVPTRTQKPFLVFFFSPVQLRRGMMEWLWWEPGVQLSSAHHSLISVHKPSLNTHFLLICNIPPHPSPPSLFPLQKPFPVSSHCRPLILEILLFISLLGYEAASDREWRRIHHSASCGSSPELLTQDSPITNINPARHTFGVWFLMPRVINQ